MPFFVWAVFAVLLAMWSGLVWGTFELAQWAAGFVASGRAVDWAVVVGQVGVPAWLTWFVDPSWISRAFDVAIRALEAMPGLVTDTGWLAVALWFVWGLGAAGVLLAFAALHWAIARWRRSTVARPG